MRISKIAYALAIAAERDPASIQPVGVEGELHFRVGNRVLPEDEAIKAAEPVVRGMNIAVPVNLPFFDDSKLGVEPDIEAAKRRLSGAIKRRLSNAR
jgi:hypothetical protein